MSLEDEFRELARSSPWRWEAVGFEVSYTEPRRPPVRAVVVRPETLTVHDARGGLLFDGVQRLSGGEPPQRGALRRADREQDGAPMWQSYRWVAMLDPAELTDGVDGDPGTDVLAVDRVEHHGRPALEALLRPTPAYAPRCSCCPLLPCAACDVWEGLPVHEHAEAHRVRVDLETAVCVLTSEVGGPTPGAGHDLRLTAVRTASG